MTTPGVSPKWAPFAGEQDCARELAARVAALLRDAISERGKASLVLSGGRTPGPMLRELRKAELPWQMVAVTLVDERCVPAADPASNLGMLREQLGKGSAAAAAFVPLYADEAWPAGAVAAGWGRVRELAERADVVVLGMGTDGHFASLFAGDEASSWALNPRAPAGCVATRAPREPVQRVSWTLSAILAARNVLLHITGTKKLELLRAASAGQAPELPVHALLRACGGRLQVYATGDEP